MLTQQQVMNAAYKAYKESMSSKSFAAWLEYQKTVNAAFWGA